MQSHTRPFLQSLCGGALVLAMASNVAAQGAELTLTNAKTVLAAAEAAARTMQVALTCAVVDNRGDIVAVSRMDNARFFTVNVAHGKARATAYFGGPSGTLGQIANLGLDGAVGDPLFFLQGAVPLARGGRALGAVGCSSATGAQDEEAAKAGAAALVSK